MRWNQAFIYTLREDPAETELVSHKLMTRAGMIMKAAAGIYTYLPLGLRVLRKIEDIIREEMAHEGASELLMPMVVPAELWKESGRWNYYGKELLRIKDRKDNDFCLAPTHEEVIVDIARRSVKSYRDLPLALYQIQGKFRDEMRPRFGLMRGREFIMKDAYSFHATEESLDTMYWAMHSAYTRIFKRTGLHFRPVEADSGTIGGDVTHEFHVLADSGEDKIIYCTQCDYAANAEKAIKADIETLIAQDTPPAEDVETPGKQTIEELSTFLAIDPQQTIKMLVYVVDEEKTIAVLIRGDLDCNEIKLRSFFSANEVLPADERHLNERNFAVGYLGPIALPQKIEIVADHSIKTVTDGVCGANRLDWHTQHILPSRDLPDLTYGDFSFADKGDTCARCGGILDSCRGIEVGQVFKLGTKYSGAMNMNFLDESGKTQTPTMGCYGIGVGRTAASAVEQNHDANGIVWPIEIAPYLVSLLCLDPDDDAVMQESLSLHNQLEALGIECLLDDRKERPGVKFKDHDLIGIPLQLVIGARSLKNETIEMKIRKTGDKTAVAQKDIVETVIATIAELKKESSPQ